MTNTERVADEDEEVGSDVKGSVPNIPTTGMLFSITIMLALDCGDFLNSADSYRYIIDFSKLCNLV